MQAKDQEINLSPEERRFAKEREYFSNNRFEQLFKEYQQQIKSCYEKRSLVVEAISKNNQNITEKANSIIFHYNNLFNVAAKVVDIRAHLLLAPPYDNEFAHQDKDSLEQLNQERIKEILSLISGHDYGWYPSGKRVEDYDWHDIKELLIPDKRIKKIGNNDANYDFVFSWKG
jgi:hypothetical protein